MPGAIVIAVDFTKQIQKAEEAARRRNYDFAIKLYQQLLDIDPDQADARGGLRIALKKRHEQKKGGKFLRTLSGAGPMALAKTMRKAGRHGACAKALESYLESNPLDEGANLMLGMALEDGGHFKSARAVYEFLAQIAPRNPEGLKRAGAMSYRQGDHEKALDYYQRALDADPRDQEAIKARKDLAAEQALSRTDDDQHSRAQIKDKPEAQRLERAQRMYHSEEDLREELARLENALAESPSDPDLLIELGAVHEKLKDPEAALDMIERALQYRRDSYELVCRAGDLRAKVLKKRLAKADSEAADAIEHELFELEVEDYRRRVDMHPGDAALRLALGKRLMRLEDYDAAASELQKAVGDIRVARDAHVALASCFQHKGFLDLARKEYERALEGSQSDERSKEILYNLGAIAEAEGDSSEARSFYARIFEIDISYRDVASKMEQFRQS